jgi:hypothetical protein
VYGEDGVRFYTRPKVVTAKWGKKASAPPANLAFPTGD